MRLVATALILALLPACIELDQELDEVVPTYENPGDPDGNTPDRPTDVATPPTEATPEPPAPQIDVLPAEASLCETVLVSVLAPDSSTVVDARFVGTGTLDILTLDARDDEVLMTVSIPSDATEGVFDLVLEHDAQPATFIEDAFDVSGDLCDG